MSFASIADRDAIENKMPWAERDVAHSVWSQLSQTAGKYGERSAVTFQMFSGDNDPAETLTWSQLQGKVAQTANLFRDLGVGTDDVVAFLLPNAMETVLTYLGGTVAGIVNPINPLLDADQIGAILKETNAKVLVTLRAFPKTDVAQKAAEAVKLAPNVKTVIEVDLLRYITGLNDFQRGDQLALKETTATTIVGQCRQSGNNRRVSAEIAIGAFQAPNRDDDLFLDAVFRFNCVQFRCVRLQRGFAIGDPFFRRRAIKVIPDRLGKFRLIAVAFDHFGIVLHGLKGAIKGGGANPSLKRATSES